MTSTKFLVIFHIRKNKEKHFRNMFNNRTYRKSAQKKGLIQFSITVKETDLHIQAVSDLSRKAVNSVLKHRGFIESYASRHPGFYSSLVPLFSMDPAPKIVQEMMEAGQRTGVGPMAAVAGAIASHTGMDLLNDSDDVIVENGGDIFIKTKTDTVFSIFAGKSPLSMKVGVHLEKREAPFALCTSSGTIGHSKSFGRADAVTILSPSCPLADAAATALANTVKNTSDIKKTIETGKNIQGIEGIIIIKDKSLGAWGALELVNLA